MFELNVASMTCGHCVGAVTRAVKSIDPEAQVEVDLSKRKVKVESIKDRQAIVKALEVAGYRAQ